MVLYLIIFGIVLMIVLSITVIKLCVSKIAGKRAKNIISLMKAYCKIQKNNEKLSDNPFAHDNDYYTSADGKRATFKLNEGVFIAEIAPDGERIIVKNVLNITPKYGQFTSYLLSKKDEWPVGVIYNQVFNNKVNKQSIDIILYVDIDYKDDALDQIEGYIRYSNDLILDLSKQYNTYCNEINNK